MAKLNVKVIGEVIEWNGEQYRKVERKAAVGDVVQANEDTIDVTYGAFYEITDVEDGEFSFNDNVGDSRDRSVDDEDFVVYEKLTEPTPKSESTYKPGDKVLGNFSGGIYTLAKRRPDLDGERYGIAWGIKEGTWLGENQFELYEEPPALATQPESSELFTYENNQYRKVKRRANVGERVLVIESFSFGKVGDVAIVTKSPSIVDDVETDKHELMNDTRYVVLEPVLYEPTYAYAGVTYRPTVAGEKPTHFVRKPDVDKHINAVSGKVYAIKSRDYDGDYRFDGEYGGEHITYARKVIGLVRKESELSNKPIRLTIGDYVKVVKLAMHNYNIGEIGHITVDEKDNQPYKAEKVDGSIGNWLRESEVVRATNAEISAYEDRKAELTKPARVPVGAYVKITNDGGNSGKLAKVTEDDFGRLPYKCATIDGEFLEWCNADEFEVLSEADAKLAVEAETARKKWAAIGRKVDEYKTGDVVEIVRNQSGDVVGTITEITRASNGSTGHAVVNKRGGGVGTWMADSNAIKLITPVEQRFDHADSAC